MVGDEDYTSLEVDAVTTLTACGADEVAKVKLFDFSNFISPASTRTVGVKEEIEFEWVIDP